MPNIILALRMATPGARQIIQRPTGVMIVVTDRMVMKKLGSGGPTDWRPKYGDLVADDWEIIDIPAAPEPESLP